MTPLEDLIRRMIAREGPMPVDRYMALALGHPEHGYYRGRPAVGAAGDFVTAPEVSQMFGELIGLWCADLWGRAGAPDPVMLAELGPGRGTLMHDALRAVGRALPGFAQAARLHLVEINPDLRADQERRLAPWDPAWHEDVAGLPDGPLLLIANEFLDALPVRQFARRAGTVMERVVAAPPEGGLAFALAPPVGQAGRVIAARIGSGPDALIELSPAREALATEIGRRVAAGGGGALIVDYGAAALDGADTLQAVREHARHDPLAEPGAADLTSHVDFGALARAAEAAGAAVFGPVAQGVFLERLGLAARRDRLAAGATPDQRAALDTAYARLTGAEAMGSLFQALAIVHPELGPPAGFDA